MTLIKVLITLWVFHAHPFTYQGFLMTPGWASYYPPYEQLSDCMRVGKLTHHPFLCVYADTGYEPGPLARRASND